MMMPVLLFREGDRSVGRVAVVLDLQTPLRDAAAGAHATTLRGIQHRSEE